MYGLNSLMRHDMHYTACTLKDGDGFVLAQFHYLERPIGGVPSSCPSILDLLQQLAKAHMDSSNKPVIVMCKCVR